LNSSNQGLGNKKGLVYKKPTNRTLFFKFLRLGLTAFGGPAMVAYIRNLSVDRNGWLREDIFKDGVSLCQSIPGATAMQMAAYVGLMTNGLKGGLSSYIGFALPAFTLMLMLSIAYTKSENISQVVSLFKGLQVVVVALIANATYSFGFDILRQKDYRKILIVLLSAILLWFSVSPFLVIIGIALIGGLIFRDVLNLKTSPAEEEPKGWSLRHVIILLGVVMAGVIPLYFLDARLFSLAILMFKIDLFAFGGAFGSIPLMLHEVVHVRGWLDSKTLMDGIALGQVTPGPIVITATFIGYLLHGFIGALVATVAIFTPSFIILAGVLPFYNKIKNSAFFFRASNSIIAIFVGLLLYATIKFASAVPWDIVRGSLFVGALAALLLRVDILYVVIVCSIISMFVL